MDFRLEDFVPAVQENIKRYHNWIYKDNSVYNGAIATMCNFEENDKVPQIARHLQIFKELGEEAGRVKF